MLVPQRRWKRRKRWSDNLWVDNQDFSKDSDFVKMVDFVLSNHLSLTSIFPVVQTILKVSILDQIDGRSSCCCTFWSCCCCCCCCCCGSGGSWGHNALKFIPWISVNVSYVKKSESKVIIRVENAQTAENWQFKTLIYLFLSFFTLKPNAQFQIRLQMEEKKEKVRYGR